MSVREELTKLLMESYDRGVKDATQAAIDSIQQVLLLEREACAQIADAEASIEGIAQRAAAAIRARGEHMTTIHFWCPLRRAYVSMQVPTETAFKLTGLT